MTIGERIKEVRKEKGLTQKKLGELSGIAESNIRKYENGKQNPKIETIQKIASALEINEYELQGITTQDIIKSLSETTSFFNYLHALGYGVYESPYDNKWEITIKESGQKIYISSAEMNLLESTTKENIYLRIFNYLHDEKHNQ